MTIRKAVAADAPQVAKVHVESWRTTYEGILPSEFLERLSIEGRTKQWEGNIASGSVYVAENKDGQIVGFSSGGKERTGNYESYKGELYAIYILEDFQRRGLGRALVKPVLAELKGVGFDSMLVWVLEDNASVNFYKALGGRYVDEMEIEIAGGKYNEIAYGWRELPGV